MYFVIPFTRAGIVELLRKARPGAPKAGHKYIKRVPRFRHGRMEWDYYYADDKARTSGRAHHDPHDKHSHHLIEEIKKHHPNLLNKLKRTVDITISALKRMLGIREAKVIVGDDFHVKHVKPYVDEEEAGGESKRSPLQRTHKAFEMLPDYIKEMIDPETRKKFEGQQATGGPLGMWKGLKSFTLNTIAEDPGMHLFGAPRGYATVDKIVILEHSFSNPMGEAKFNSAKTMGEKVIWHEVGHHVHQAMEARQKEHPDRKAIEEYKKKLPGEMISDYAKGLLQGGYEWWEDFAEHFACALAHPKELAERCPERYVWFRKHVLTSLPDIGVMLDTPDGDLAWWESKSDTPASKLLRHLQHRSPAPAFHNYYSEKDQFYSVQKDGRTIYLRYGPQHKDEEAGWDRMPDTTYTETVTGADGKPMTVTLPKHERTLGPRFKKTESIKEIYDEDGRSLTDRQAYFYLGQDDAKAIAAAPEDPTRENLDAYLKADDKKGPNSTRTLSYKMYTTLGFQLEHGKEVTRIKKVVAAQKKWDAAKKKPIDKKTGEPKPRPDFGLERHEWAPVEIDSSTFRQKTGTFKFGDIKPAKKQPWPMRDPESGAVLTRYDEATGKQVPVLAARVYEQENIDGTFTRIEVNESSPFNVGDRVWLPTTKGGGGWEQRRLKKGDSLDPFQLARNHNTTARELLAINGKYDRGQISDPILAALINPHGKPIMDATILQDLMRSAALDRTTDPITGKIIGRRAWLCLRGSPHTDSAIGHIQVEFDGAGAPKVVGDYWARKLGKDEIRIDELLNREDEIDLPRIKEKKGTKRKTLAGELVWFVDPKSERRILGTIIERKIPEEGGPTVYRIQPRKNQGIGISKKVVSVTRVQATTTALIPDRPGLRKRFIEPLEKDVLFYMDEVPVGGSTEDPDGVIRVLPPKNGMFNYAELKGIPGIRIIEDRGQVAATISPQDIPRFRERFGGFVMDSRVKAKLKQLDDRTRSIIEGKEKKQLIKPEDLEAPDGNIAPDGPLGKLVIGDEGIQPGDHRIGALQQLVKNGGRLYAAHYMGTGKTALAVMAGELMRNLEDENGDPHPNRISGKIMFLGPPNTVVNTYNEYVKFARPPTLLGTSQLAGAQQVPTLPAQKPSESEAAYAKRALAHWKDGLEDNPGWWNPWTDTSDTVICGIEYFREHEKVLRFLKQFEGMIVDEAHKIARDNEVSRAIERWNPDLKLLLMMSGTPIKNKLDALPRIISLVTNGEVNLGTTEEFVDRYLQGSAVMRAEGSRNPPRTDLNPQRIGELIGYIGPHIHVATTADVLASGKKSMPAVLLDENEPAHMTGQQARMYRAAVAMLTPEERNALAVSAALGVDEQSLLSEEARSKINVARGIANCLAYKNRDQREEAIYRTVEYAENTRGNMVGKEVNKVFELPTMKQMMNKRPKGWGGRWPTLSGVKKGIISEGYLKALDRYMDRILGVSYESLAGKKISAKLLKRIKSGEMMTGTGEPWTTEGGKLKNPDFGPEGMICRGHLDEASGEIKPIKAAYFDSVTGRTSEVTIDPGTFFVRDITNAASGLFYASDDWDFTGRFDEPKRKGGDDPEGGDDDEDEAPKKRKKGQQGPKEGHEAFSLQRSPHRRRERAMFDATVTQGNAKCDKLEQNLREQWAAETGDGPATQHVFFGNRIGSSVRTMESKLRTMGFMDVNEALGPPSISTEHDKARALGTRKFYVTYMGIGATLGDRDINSEIYRRQQDDFGGDTGISMFVWRTMYGHLGKKILSPGRMEEPWPRKARKIIARSFVDNTGRKPRRDGSPSGMEVPMRVVGHLEKDGTVGQRYIYESEVPPQPRKEIAALEVRMRAQRGAEKEATEAAIKKLLMPFATDRKPLSDTQIDIFNNTQCVVASDAATVGLNWPGVHLTMYDSLFSPMEEEQRIARSARMLPPAIRGPAKKLILKIGAYIEAIEAKSGFKEYEGYDSAMLIVSEALENALTSAERSELHDLPGGAPDQIIEAWFAQRAFRKIASARDEVSNLLRTEGVTPDKSKPPGKGNFIGPESIQESDIMNEIIREHLTAFDREIMKSRRYLVHVKRLTTSCDLPEFEVIEVPGLGKIEVPTGKYVTESPVQAERSMMTQGRAKKVPYEYLLKKLQEGVATHTKYDYVDAFRGSLGAFARFPDDYTPPKAGADKHEPPEGESPPSGKPEPKPVGGAQLTPKKGEPTKPPEPELGPTPSHITTKDGRKLATDPSGKNYELVTQAGKATHWVDMEDLIHLGGQKMKQPLVTKTHTDENGVTWIRVKALGYVQPKALGIARKSMQFHIPLGDSR